MVFCVACRTLKHRRLLCRTSDRAMRTHVVSNCSDPEWNETFLLNDVGVDEVCRHQLYTYNHSTLGYTLATVVGYRLSIGPTPGLSLWSNSRLPPTASNIIIIRVSQAKRDKTNYAYYKLPPIPVLTGLDIA